MQHFTLDSNTVLQLPGQKKWAKSNHGRDSIPRSALFLIKKWYYIGNNKDIYIN